VISKPKKLMPLYIKSDVNPDLQLHYWQLLKTYKAKEIKGYRFHKEEKLNKTLFKGWNN